MSTILIADDEAPVRRLVARLLDGPGREVLGAADGREALALAAGRGPDLILLDVNMPRQCGLEVLAELRRRPETRLTPVILLTAACSTADKVDGLGLGADDYVTKPFDAPELRARVDGLLARHARALSANPLTGLPGNHAIEEETARRLRGGEPFAFLYADIDRFKAFNDAHGFAEGDRLLLETAGLLRRSFGSGFVGHVGGDDFVAMCELEEAPFAAQRLAYLFDESAARRAGPGRRPTLSIGIVTPGRRPLASYAEVAAAAAEMKGILKGETGRMLSRFAFDRRTGPPRRGS